MFKIMGNYQGNTEDEVIDEGFETTGYARRMLMEYIMAFGRDWGRLWIVDQNGNRVYQRNNNEKIKQTPYASRSDGRD